MNLFKQLCGLFKGKQPRRNLELALPDPVETLITEEIEATPVDISEEPPVDPGQLTKNFHVDEFVCRDGTPVPKKYMKNVKKLAKNLQTLRDELGKVVKINSGYRSPSYNKKIKGAKNSQHMKAMAADIKVRGISPERLATIIQELIKAGKMEKGGVGKYPNFTHYDARGRNARWRGSRKKN